MIIAGYTNLKKDKKKGTLVCTQKDQTRNDNNVKKQTKRKQKT